MGFVLLWPQSHLLSNDVAQGDEHTNPTGETGSQAQLLEHNYRYMAGDLHFEGGS